MIIIHVFETQHNDFVNFSNPGQTLRFYSAFSYEILFPPRETETILLQKERVRCKTSP